MELLVLVPIIGLLVVYIAYKEWLNIAFRQWQAELNLFKRRLAVYEQLKSAIGRARAGDAVSQVDTDRFAQAMSDMRFLFDEDLERFVGSIYDALLKKHALDALLEKAAGRDDAATDHDLIETARGISRELASHLTHGIYLDVPEHMEKFMRREPCHRHVTQRRRRHRNRVLMRVPGFREVLSQALPCNRNLFGLARFLQ